MIHAASKLSRKNKQALLISFDSIAIIGSIFFAFAIRLGYWYFPFENVGLLILMLGTPILALPIFIRFGLYHTVIRYAGFNAIWKICQSVTIYAILWGLISFMTGINGIPRSVIIINWILLIMIIVGSRVLARWLSSEFNINNNLQQKINVLIYGAGSAGRQLCNALNDTNEYRSIAFIDDSPEFYNQSINGLKVFSRDDLEWLIERENIKEVLLALPTVSRKRRNEIINFLESYKVVVRSLPGLTELAQGKVKVNDLLEIDVRDLLGRKLVKPSQSLLKTNIKDKVVLISGAGGSIGSEICRQILTIRPKKIVLFEVSESALYVIEQELKSINTHRIEIFPVIGSVADKDRIEKILKFYDVQTIYHAAAYKHVPLVEFNQSQGVLNNTIGTLIIAEAAIISDVETFVLISTDKAVRPTNVMGATKRIAELILQALAARTEKTCFTMVRFGNVLDSSGSVIPLFKKQIQKGGPVTVTHKDIVRYFMTIPEAVELVIQAGAMAKGGEVFLLDMGKPIRIYDLALKMIKLSGLQLRDKNNPEGDIDIQYVGLRPGEKLYEELLVVDNSTVTENKLIMRAEEKMISWDKLEPKLIKIKEAAQNSDTEKIYKLLIELVPEFKRDINSPKAD